MAWDTDLIRALNIPSSYLDNPLLLLSNKIIPVSIFIIGLWYFMSSTRGLRPFRYVSPLIGFVVFASIPDLFFFGFAGGGFLISSFILRRRPIIGLLIAAAFVVAYLVIVRGLLPGLRF